MNEGSVIDTLGSRNGPGLPDAFDPEFYRSNYPDVASLDDAAAEAHWRRYGIGEGRVGSRAGTRTGFMALLGNEPLILEIGPLANPCVTGPHVKYFDVLPTEALKEKAELAGLDVSSFPEIHYSSETADLAVVPDRFAAVASSHAVEHQPDLVQHLADVAALLLPGGRYWLAVPDHRYCFDHFLPASTIAEVLDAHLRNAKRHSAKDIINMMAMGTHNDPVRHWDGDHGEPSHVQSPESLDRAMATFLGAGDTYLDTHAWRFTPDTFGEIIATLADKGLSALQPVRILPTVRGQLEFFAVLELRSERAVPG